MGGGSLSSATRSIGHPLVNLVHEGEKKVEGSRSFTAPLKYGERLGDIELDHVATDDRFLLLIFGRGNDRSVIRVSKGRRRFSRVGKERSNDR